MLEHSRRNESYRRTKKSNLIKKPKIEGVVQENTEHKKELNFTFSEAPPQKRDEEPSLERHEISSRHTSAISSRHTDATKTRHHRFYSLGSLCMSKSALELFSYEHGKLFNRQYNRSDPGGGTSKFTVREFLAERPDKHVDYFSRKNGRGLCVVIPFYNEEVKALRETLKDINENIRKIRALNGWEHLPIDVVAIGDGWGKMDQSVKDFLHEIFPDDGNDQGQGHWLERLDLRLEQMKYLKQRGKKIQHRTFIFQQDKSYYSEQESMLPSERYKFSLSFIVKVDNRRKHNSHEWFFNAFVRSKKPQYMFLTDAFTKFEPSTIRNLIDEMEKDKSISVATGRQRVMSKKQQGCESEMFGSISDWLRRVQCFDFEASNTVYNGAFANCGCLPVIPGPCGCFRYDHMCVPGKGTGQNDDGTERTPVQWYLDQINKPAEKTGWIMGNLKIAEDRVLSYAAVLKTAKPAYMAFVTSAVFYFESEGFLHMLVKQRRRWINGTVAGWIWLLPRMFESSSLSIMRRIYLIMLILMQLFTYVGAFLGPAIVMSCCMWSFGYIGEIIIQYESYDEQISSTVATILWVFWILHVVIHSGKESYNGLIFYTLVFLGALTVIASSLTFVHYYATQDGPIETPYAMLMKEEFDEYAVVFWMILAAYFLPIIQSIFISVYFKSPCLMLQSMFHFYLFLPTMTAWMTSYSFSRTHDLSWGNRPSSDDFDNLAASKAAAKREEIKSYADALTLFMVIGNISLFMCKQNILLVFTMFLFAIIFFEMLLSFIYMLSWGTWYKCLTYCRCCRQRLCGGPASARTSLLDDPDFHLFTDNESPILNDSYLADSRQFFPDSTISVGVN